MVASASAHRICPELIELLQCFCDTEVVPGVHLKAGHVEAVVSAYRKHVELTDEELDRLEGVMYIRPLYLVCFGYHRDLTNGVPFDEWWFIEPPEYIASTAAATRAAFRR